MPERKPQFEIGMVFGVFDGFHPGHRHFLTEASRRCQKLIVVVAVEEMIRLQKKRLPRYGYGERAERIKAFDPELVIVPSDAAPGKWRALREYDPEMIFLGYDQQALAQALTPLDRSFVFIGAHHPDRYKSSLINDYSGLALE